MEKCCFHAMPAWYSRRMCSTCIGIAELLMAMRLLAVDTYSCIPPGQCIPRRGRGLLLHHVTWALLKVNGYGKELPDLKRLVLSYFHDCRNADTPTWTMDDVAGRGCGLLLHVARALLP